MAVLADPMTGEGPEELAIHLRSLPSAFRLYAAVDGDGAVRATAGCGVFAADATVIFVNTHPCWRLRGIGRAMTAAALRAAQDAGARCACLDASAAGLPIYRQLGFETVARAIRYFRGESK
ncbi:MAG TPA: GNAT family N-acetyltransferase [Jatrophihabitans sp.]